MILPVVKQNKKSFIILKCLIVLSLVVISVLIYFTGGTKNGLDHLLYLPVIAGGLIFSPEITFVIALSAGFLCGPYMPFDVLNNIAQSEPDWLIRLSMLILAGALTSVAKHQLLKMLNERQTLFIKFATTNIPNIYILNFVDYSLFDNKDGVSAVTLGISESEKLLFYFGQENYQNLLIEIHEELLNKLSYEKIILSNNSNFFWFIVNNHNTDKVRREIAQIIRNLRQTIKLPIYFEFALGAELITDLNSREKDVSLFEKSTQMVVGRISKNTSIVDSNSEIARDYSLLSEIEKALKNDEFFLVYQPIKYHLEDNIFRCEALIRWDHPEKGLISPAEFIPLVENTLLINPLSLWVLETAINEIIKYNALGIEFICSINISPRNLYSRSFVKRVGQIINKYDFDTSQIKFEITEGLAINISEISLNNLNDLNDLGIDLIIDDFGSGHSSISYLVQLPIKYVKLDISFTGKLLEDPKQLLLFEHVVKLLKGLNLKILAEGIETKEQYELIKKSNLDFYQGYYFSKPLDGKALEKFIKNKK